jgi:hypothetical protein
MRRNSSSSFRTQAEIQAKIAALIVKGLAASGKELRSPHNLPRSNSRKSVIAFTHYLYWNYHLSLKQLAECTARSPAFWSTQFGECGLPAQATSHRSASFRPTRYYPLGNERAFTKIDTPEAAYWLGFL